MVHLWVLEGPAKKAKAHMCHARLPYTSRSSLKLSESYDEYTRQTLALYRLRVHFVPPHKRCK